MPQPETLEMVSGSPCCRLAVGSQMKEPALPIQTEAQSENGSQAHGGHTPGLGPASLFSGTGPFPVLPHPDYGCARALEA